MSVPHRTYRWLPLATLLTLASLLCFGWWWAVSASRVNVEEHDRLLAEQTALRISDWTNSRLAILSSLRTLEANGHDDTATAWADRVTVIAQHIGGFQGINWTDEHGIITRIAPVVGNEAALGRSVLRHPEAGKVLAAAIESGETRLSPPIDLFQGGRGFTCYLPVMNAAGQFQGAINGVFRADMLSRACVDGLAARYAVRISDGGSPLIAIGDLAHAGGATLSVDVDIGDRRWKLEIASIADNVRLVPSLLVLSGGLILSCLLAWLLRLALLRREQAVAARDVQREMAARLQAAERLESLGRMAGGVAHDFNNLLTVIRGHADLLGGALVDFDDRDTGMAGDVQAIRTACERAARLTGQLLAFARRAPSVHGVADVGGHLRELLPMLRNLATEAVGVDLEVPSHPTWAACSPGVLDRVMVNLVANARDAMVEGQGHVWIVVDERDGRVTIEVRDDGAGMPPEVAARAFEPFFTARPGGTGLGLSTVYGLVTQRGGEIELESQLGRGTVFRLSLPTAEPAPPTQPLAQGELSTDKVPVRVILVEDEEAVRATLLRALRRAGFTVQSFTSGDEAVAADPDGDVLVTDFVMPGMHGVAVARALQANHPELRAIVVSGYAGNPEVINALVADGGHFLQKPFEVAELIGLIRRLAPRTQSDT